MKKIISLLFCLVFIINIQPAYAYLDPGTGSVFVQGLLAGGAGILAIIKIYWSRLKFFLINIFKKNNSVILEKPNDTAHKS